MIRIFTGRELEFEQPLARSMFKDRAKQFHHRLGWAVSVNDEGLEKDEYDTPDAMYVVVVDCNGLHAGSMRLLPTTSNTMISDHFSYVVEDINLQSSSIWECTRFCISEKTPSKDAALKLFAAGASILEQYQLKGFIAVFDPFMERIYQRYGVRPEVLGSALDSMGSIVKLGIWHDDNMVRADLVERVETAELVPN